MSESPLSAFTPDQPEDTLVEREGVNAGSASSTDESSLEQPPSVGDPLDDAVLRGDGPTGTAVPEGARGDAPAADDELVGAPDTSPTAPGQYAAGPGQDTGSAG